MKTAQIHRFGDTVAMFLSKGKTVYLSPQDAHQLSRQLLTCAQNVKKSKYIDGNFKTFNIELENTGYNGCDYKVKRGAA